MKFVEELDIFVISIWLNSSQKTIDYDWNVKLRQKVYLKGILESFSKEELC